MMIGFALSISLLLSGCSGPAPAEVPEASPISGASRLITDCVGRQVEIPEAPQRIAALDSFSGEVMVLSGAGERMVSAPNGVCRDVLLQRLCPGLEALGSTSPMSGGTVSGEGLLALSPDLALVKGALYASQEEMKKLDKLGIPYLVVDYSSMEEQQAALDLIGEVLGGRAGERVDAISSYYADVVSRAETISEMIPEEDRLNVYHSINSLVLTDGAESVGRDWIECVGAVNVACQGGNTARGDYNASREQIYAWDPDVVICNEAETKDYLLTNEKWTGLRAVQEGQVYNIPVGATRWGQRGSLETYFAILWLGTTIYPEYYGDIDLKQEVMTFYDEVLDCPLDDATYASILSGRGLRGTSTGAGS